MDHHPEQTYPLSLYPGVWHDVSTSDRSEDENVQFEVSYTSFYSMHEGLKVSVRLETPESSFVII